MTRSRRERFIHRQLLQRNVRPFYEWKQEGHSLSYFHKNIIEYDYVIRNYIYQTTCLYDTVYPLRVKHRGWPTQSPMTPQAWSVMEILAGIEHLEYRDGDIPVDMIQSLIFISTGILQSEIKHVWAEILNTIYICNEQKAEILMGLMVAVANGYYNRHPETDFIQPNCDNSIERMKEFLTQIRKIQLLREFYYNPREQYDAMMKWVYGGGLTPYILRRLFSHHEMSVEYIHLISCAPPPSLPFRDSSSFHPQSPLAQSETSGSTSSQPSLSEESDQSP
jgi:hypothetical protein